MGLTCDLPDAPIQELQNLQLLDLSNNRISGTIPEFLPETLVEIRMNNNELIGAVPHSLATHPNLGTLRLDYNQIEGLPIEWTSMVYDASNSPFPLQSVHLGHNSLQVCLLCIHMLKHSRRVEHALDTRITYIQYVPTGIVSTRLGIFPILTCAGTSAQ